jgi:multiple sugar transport system substrate-binding protein
MHVAFRRRLPLVGLVAATGLLVAACGGGDASSKTTAPPPPTAISGTVVMAEPGDNPGDLALRKKLADNFMKANPGVTVKFTIVPGTSYDQKIQTMIAGGNAPDIFGSGDVQIPNIVAKKFALDLGPYVKRDKYDLSAFYPQIIQNLTYNGQLVGLTDNYDTQVMYYNTNLFKAAGVAEPTNDWTWDDFVNAATQLTKGTGSSKVYGAVYDNWFGPYFDQIWANGGDPFPDGGKTCGYASPAAITAFTQIQDLYKSGVSPAPSAFSEKGSEQAFLKGNVGMLIGNGRWSAYTFKDITKFGWKIAPLPKGSAGRANFFHIGMFAIARTSKNPEAAFQFLKYMVSEEGIKAGLADMQGIPSRKDIADSESFKDTPFNNEHNTVQPFIDSLPTVHRAPSLTNFNEVQDAVTAKLSPIWTLKSTPAQVLPGVCTAITPKLSAGGAVGGG